jgi:hypothetical protein
VPSYLGLDHPDEARRDALAHPHWAALAGDDGAVWLNPPYTPATLLSTFLERAAATAAAGVPVIGLVPASTGAVWWWQHVVGAGAQVEFLRGRVSFVGPHSTGTPAPWASALTTWVPPT